MKCTITFVLLSSLAALCFAQSDLADFKVLAYFTNYAQYRACSPYFAENVADVAKKLTNLHFAFVEFNTSGYIIPGEWNDCYVDTWPGCGEYTQNSSALWILASMREINPDLKISFTLGGYTWGGNYVCPYFSQVASDDTTRAFFIQQAIDFARAFNLDGIDIDWEYPGDASLNCSANDPIYFKTLLTDFRAAINAEANSTGKPPLLFSICASALPSTITQEMIADLYKIPYKVVDYINVLSFDYYGSWSAYTGINAPLFDPTGGLSVNLSIQYLLSIGVPPRDIVMGIPAYGATFDVSQQSPPYVPGLPFSGPGKAGCAEGSGILTYFEIQELLQEAGAEGAFDPAFDGAYAYAASGNPWAGYDDLQAVQDKVAYAVSLGLGGVFVWTVDYDNFTAGYPFVSAMWPVVSNVTSTTTSTSSASTSSAAVSTTSAASSSSTASSTTTATSSSAVASSTSSTIGSKDSAAATVNYSAIVSVVACLTAMMVLC